MSTQTTWEQGQTLMKAAEEKERLGDIEKAFQLYKRGLDLFVRSLGRMQQSKRKMERQQIVNTYMNHAEQLKRKIYPNGLISPNWSGNKNNQSRNRPRKQPVRRNNNNVKKQYSKHELELRSRIENEIIQRNLNVRFSDVIGLENVKQALLEAVILPSQRPDIFKGPRAPPIGLLLFGPPGNGKTFIAKALASECNATFFSVTSATLTSRFVGEGEKLVRILFEIARENAPSIIFIDEIDSLLTSRNKEEQESSRRMKTEFLIQLDGIQSKKDGDVGNVLLVGATNLPWTLDNAILRRFPKRILVDLPGKKQREYIIKSILSKDINYKLSNNELNNIINLSDGYSCSDLTNLVSDASMGPVRDLGMDILQYNNKPIPNVNYNHFKDSFENIKPSYTKQSLNQTYDWNKKFGTKLKLNKKQNKSFNNNNNNKNNNKNNKNNKNNNSNKSNSKNKNNNSRQVSSNDKNKMKKSSSWLSMFG